MDSAHELTRARELLAAAGRIVALTGAGISTDSGIPDFRGPQGVWTKDPAAERMSNLQAYVQDREVRERSWQARLQHPGWHAEPNTAHRTVAELERTGRVSAIITQNIDGLHQAAGSDPERVVELHGTMFETQCLACADRRDMREALERVSAGESDPPCDICGGILKSATISFGQSLDASVLEQARRHAQSCDLMLVAGSSLTVQPAAGLAGIAPGSGARLVLCNAAETPYDALADVVLRGRVGDVLPELV